MIGSPDLLVFAGGEGFGQEAAGDHHQDTQDAPLPDELSVPLDPPANPWPTAAQFHRDFILVAEFSEQVCVCVRVCFSTQSHYNSCHVLCSYKHLVTLRVSAKISEMLVIK